MKHDTATSPGLTPVGRGIPLLTPLRLWHSTYSPLPRSATVPEACASFMTEHELCFHRKFFVRDSIYAIVRICYRPSVQLSVRLSVTRVDQSKTVEVRIMQLSPQSIPMTLVSSWLISPQNSKGNIGSGDAK